MSRRKRFCTRCVLKYIKEAGMRYEKSKQSKNLLLAKLSLYFKSIDPIDIFYLAWFMPLTSFYLGGLFRNYFYMYDCSCLALVKQP